MIDSRRPSGPARPSVAERVHDFDPGRPRVLAVASDHHKLVGNPGRGNQAVLYGQRSSESRCRPALQPMDSGPEPVDRGGPSPVTRQIATVIPSAPAASRSAGVSREITSGSPKRRLRRTRFAKSTTPCHSPQKLDHQRRPACPPSQAEAAMGCVVRRRREAIRSGFRRWRCNVRGSQRSSSLDDSSGSSWTPTSARGRPARSRCGPRSGRLRHG